MAETALARRTREYDERVRRGRELLPQATAMLDSLRAIFGEGCKLTFAQEGRARYGEPLPDGVVPVLQTRRPEKDRAEKALAQLRQRELIS